MAKSVPERWILPLRAVCIAWLLMALAYVVWHTWSWPLILDAQVIHYADFLMAHGWAPYRQIDDMNMPVAYLADWFAMHVFGPGDLAWRMYDFFLMGTLTGAAIAIARRVDWLAGLFAGVLFALVHTADGPMNTGQRDEVMAVLLVVSYAFLFEGVRARRPVWLAGFGAAWGLAAGIKPTVAPFFFVVLALAWVVLRRRGVPGAAYVGCACAGGVAAAAVFFGFLLRYGVVHEFLGMNRTLMPYYASLQHKGFLPLLRESLPRPVRWLVPFGALALWASRREGDWERWALAIGVLLGAFSYFVQGKGFTHHRYAAVAFLLLWIGLELAAATRRVGWLRWVGAAGFAVGLLVVLPRLTVQVRAAGDDAAFARTLERDLLQLGVARLQGRVQCLDLVDGCLAALYRLGIVQSTGLTGDMLLFSPDHTAPAVLADRQRFWAEVQAHPPDVFVLSNEKFVDAGFDKLEQWPEFTGFLNAGYSETIERSFSGGIAYRIYLRRGMRP